MRSVKSMIYETSLLDPEEVTNLQLFSFILQPFWLVYRNSIHLHLYLYIKLLGISIWLLLLLLLILSLLLLLLLLSLLLGYPIPRIEYSRMPTKAPQSCWRKWTSSRGIVVVAADGRSTYHCPSCWTHSRFECTISGKTFGCFLTVY